MFLFLSLVGLRVNQIYDIDNKTYLIRLQGGGEEKKMLLIESGIRFHTTAFEWPKNVAPSGFSMKLRKHLKNKRLEKLQQLEADRVVDLQFGIGEAAYHVILELYDRGNIILTDYDMTILYILRPHYEGEDIRFAVREKYPSDRAKKIKLLPTEIELRDMIDKSQPGDSLRRVIMSAVDCGPTVIEHILIKHQLENCTIPKRSDASGKDDSNNTTAVSIDNKTNSKRSKNKREIKVVNSREFVPENDMKTLIHALEVC